jgi:hypothetical protein
VPIGIWLLHYVSPVMFKAGVGALLSIYCPALLFFRELPRITHGGRVADGVVGFLGGVMGGIGGLTGPAPTLWCALRGWGPDAQRAVFQTFNLVMQGMVLALYAATGVVTVEAAGMFALILPAMIIPTVIGARLYRRFSAAAFARLVLVLLSLSGFVLLGTSVAALLR